jgi:glycerol uptake facilitator-like aquaporin
MFQWGGSMYPHSPRSSFHSIVDLKSTFAEFWGTTMLIVFGCGTAITTGFDDVLAVAFCFSMMYMALSYALIHHSGAHLNPAVTMSMVLTGKISVLQAAFNWLAQFLGAAFGALLLWGTCLRLPHICNLNNKLQYRILFATFSQSCIFPINTPELFVPPYYCFLKGIHPCSEDFTFNLASNVITRHFGTSYAFLAEFMGTLLICFGNQTTIR